MAQELQAPVNGLLHRRFVTADGFQKTLVPDTFRILLQEYEWYRSDNEVEDVEEQISLARRIVYADAIPLG